MLAENGNRKLYLELLKDTLSYALWPEPSFPIMNGNERRPVLKRALVSTASRLLDRSGFEVGRRRNISEDARREGRYWPLYADTMIGRLRLDNLQECVESVIREGVEGDLIETGVWRGGACIFMRGILATYGVKDRRVFVADSFEGLPKPDASKYPSDRGSTLHEHSILAVSLEQVQQNFRRYGLLDDQVVFLKGWFKDTLPKAPIEKLAVLRLDGDLYESTYDALTNLYPKLSVGGYCIIDDYSIPTCKKAVEDYRKQHGIESDLRQIDRSSRYWRKS
jgi:hypothetical protein